MMLSLSPTSSLPRSGAIVAQRLGEEGRTKPLEQRAGSPATDGGDGSAAAAYVSPVLHYDSKAKLAVLVMRDSVTGEIEQQIPSRRIVETYRKQNERIGVSSGAEAAEAPSSFLTEASGPAGKRLGELDRPSATRMRLVPTRGEDKLSLSV